MPRIVILLASLLGSAETDAEALARLLESTRPAVQDVYFEYEGSMSFPGRGKSEVTDADGVHNRYWGSFSRRRDGATLVDVFHRYPAEPRPSEVSRESLAILGDRFRVLRRKCDPTRDPVQEEPASLGRLAAMGSIAKVLLRAELVERLPGGKWAVTLEGPEEVDGSSCRVAHLQLRNAAGDPVLGSRFWIDLDREGIILKFEESSRGGITKRMTATNVQRIRDAGGRSAWLPLEFVLESFGPPADDPTGPPGKVATNRETFTIFPESVRLEPVLRDDRFNLKDRRSAMIAAPLKLVRRDFDAQTPKKRREETPEVAAAPLAVLEEDARLAAEGGEAYVATSRNRSGPSLWDLSPWIATATSLVALGVVLLRRRVGA